MSVILILLAASLSIAICFLIAFIWSVKNDQYEDDYTPSVRMLFDDELLSENNQNHPRHFEKAQANEENRNTIKTNTTNPK
ncbi:MAG: cbb3-type cytochrome oxidase assembly protein CcoS [Bacteroidia bacterium]|nr:cbb3-type cytochrome oxidase assembly protein CcoS [Bacteroidia bacterium]